MNRLQLATILSWAGASGLQGRKRLQKVVYFLQQAGCRLDCGYTLHHFGPYSRDVADACDEMVSAGLIEESASQEHWGMQYTYRLTPKTEDLLKQANDDSIEPFQQLGVDLISENLKLLEIGSTILFYFGQSQNWDDAIEKACAFKKADRNAPEVLGGLDLARQMQGYAAK